MSNLKDLHTLIHNLTTSEKRQVRLKAGDDATYIKMFDIINKQKEYNKTKLEKKLSGIQNRSRNQQYLYDYILKEIMPLYIAKHRYFKFFKEFQELTLLFQKGLNDHFERELTKNKKKLTDKSLYELLVFYYRLESSYHSKDNFGKLPEKAFKKWMTGYNYAVNETMIAYQLIGMHQEATYWYDRINTSNYEEVSERLTQILQSPIMEDVSKYTTYQVVFEFYAVKFMGYGALENFEEAYDASVALGTYITDNEDLEYRILNYRTAFTNAVYYSIRLNDTEKYQYSQAMLDKGNHITLAEIFQYKTNHYSLIYKFWHLVNSQKWLEADNYAKEHLVAYEDNYENLYHQATCDYLLKYAFLCIILENPGKAEEYVLFVLEKFEGVTMANHIANALLIHCIIQFEQGNIKSLPHFILSVKRRIKKLKQDFEFPMALLGGLNSIAKAYINDYQPEVVNKAIKRLEATKESFSFMKTTQYFDYIAWMKSKINSKSLRETLEQA